MNLRHSVQILTQGCCASPSRVETLGGAVSLLSTPYVLHVLAVAYCVNIYLAW